jgi:hypothetical protein
MPDYSKEFLELLQSVTAKRAKTVIEHILKHGFITSEELKTVYGYNHPPRAVRDVREYGIAIETYRITGSDGRKIAAYKFGDPSKIRFSKLSGRTVLSKTIKDKLISIYGCKCFIYQEVMEERDLQIDHRVPFEVDGDGNNDMNPNNFMLLSGSANRAKSWSCEQCENWNHKKDKAICLSCYWAYPENYLHIAMLPIRRIDLIWQGENVEQYEQIKEHAISAQQNIPDFIKGIIESELKKRT